MRLGRQSSRGSVKHSGKASLRLSLDEVGSKLDELSVEQIATAAQSHDRLAERILSEAGSYLGAALATVVNLLNPERIILSGKVPRATEKILLGFSSSTIFGTEPSHNPRRIWT